jgi:Fur family transcriptional regulator, ferric uptake regulator
VGEPQTAVWFSAILISAGSVAGMDELDRTAATRLREVGQRYTGGRATLVELLAASDRPLTIPEILRARSGMPQSSVYRNLTVLEEAGLVQRVASSDEWARFELAEDLTEHHHHQICTGCGQVRDVTLPPGVERSLDVSLAKVAEASGFTLQHHRLDLVGLCEECAD